MLIHSKDSAKTVETNRLNEQASTVGKQKWAETVDLQRTEVSEFSEEMQFLMDTKEVENLHRDSFLGGSHRKVLGTYSEISHLSK